MLVPWKKSYDEPRQHIKKQRTFADKGPSSQSYGLSSGHVWMWELDHQEGWALKNWCFRTVVLEKTLELEQTTRDREGHGSQACCSRWGRKESDMTEQLNSNHKSCLDQRKAWSSKRCSKDCSLRGSSVRGISQARILELTAISFSRGSSCPRDRTQAFCIAGRFFTAWANREVWYKVDQKEFVMQR